MLSDMVSGLPRVHKVEHGEQTFFATSRISVMFHWERMSGT